MAIENHTNDERYFLRPEARAFSWKDLDDRQQEAFIQIVQSLVRAVNDLPRLDEKRQATSYVPLMLDANRATRALFLSGDRGTGKTSVLLSLIRIWVEYKTRIDELGALAKAQNGENKSTIRFEGLLRDLRILKEHVVWLPLLDMEPLPGPTNLFAAILARLEESIERFGGGSSIADAPDRYGVSSLLDACPKTHEAILDLQQLQSDVALAWDGNLAGRAGHLDPDPYAGEVLRAERVRLHVDDRFSALLNGLAASKTLFAPAGIENPLFVLPVDDCDLNPTRCVELLRLLRMISTPRLFIIALGDERITTTMFTLSIGGELQKLTANSPLSEGVPTTARAVALKAMQKLLPPAQRVHLRHLSVTEVMEFELPGTGRKVIDVMNAIPVKSKEEYLQKLMQDGNPSLASMFFQAFQEGAPEEQKGRYKDFGFFTMTVRDAADFWQLLHQSVEGTADLESGSKAYKRVWEAILSCFAPKVALAINEELVLEEKQKRDLVESTLRRPTGEWRFETGGLEFESHWGDMLRLDLDGWFFTVSPCTGWDLHAVSEKTKPAEGVIENKLSDSSASAIAFFYDLIMLGPQGVGSSTYQKLPAYPEARSTHNLMGTYWDPPIKRRGPVSIYWFLPEWRSFWEHEEFSGRWNMAIEEARQWMLSASGDKEKTQNAVEQLCYTWIIKATEIFSGTNVPRNGSISGYRIPVELWQTAAQFVIDSLNSFPDKRAYEFWLVRIALNLAPESGIPDYIYTAFIHAGLLDKLNPIDLPELRRDRAGRLEAFFRADFPELGLMLLAPDSHLISTMALVVGILGQDKIDSAEKKALTDAVNALEKSLNEGSFLVEPKSVSQMGKTFFEALSAFEKIQQREEGSAYWVSIRNTLALLKTYPHLLDHPYRIHPELHVTSDVVDKISKKFRRGRDAL